MMTWMVGWLTGCIMALRNGWVLGIYSLVHCKRSAEAECKETSSVVDDRLRKLKSKLTRSQIFCFISWFFFFFFFLGGVGWGTAFAERENVRLLQCMSSWHCTPRGRMKAPPPPHPHPCPSYPLPPPPPPSLPPKQPPHLSCMEHKCFSTNIRHTSVFTDIKSLFYCNKSVGFFNLKAFGGRAGRE